MVTKTIRIKMKNGATRLQKVQVLKSGKFKFIKNTGSSSKKSKSSKRSAVKRTVKSASSKVKKTVKQRTNMVRKKTTSRKKGFKIPVLSNPTFKKAAAGVGAGTLLTFMLGAVGQGQLAQNPVVKAAAGFATGDVVGAAASFLVGGGIQGLNLGGGGGGQTMEGLA
jgi:hypothetical protein